MLNLQKDFDYLLKVLVVGNSAVGKTSLVKRYSDDQFEESFLPTIGVDFHIKTVIKNGNILKLQIWDTAGQERYRTIVGSYWRGTSVILLTFDLTDRQSFEDIDYWLNQIDSHLQRNTVAFILVGTKSDLHRQQKITTEQATEYASKNQMKYIEISAKSGKNIEQLFDYVCDYGLKILAEKIPKGQTPNQPQIQKQNTKEIQNNFFYKMCNC